MIITKTPFRISFFGGGTDYPPWYREHGGAVLATTINKYCRIMCRRLPPFFEHKHRIVWSKIEMVKDIYQIEHPAVRAVMDWANVHEGLEIHHDGDLPARSGLGSSSSFTVGLVHALKALRGEPITKEGLAQDAIHIEQNVIGEHVGSQDQVSAAYGGLNRINFNTDNSFEVLPLEISPERKKELKSHLMLCFTGISRLADEIAKSQIENQKNRMTELKRMHEMVTEASSILTNPNTPIEEFGKLLDHNWQYKRTLSDRVSTSEIDQLYEIAKRAGATGGKLMGAGGGGFFLLFAKPELHFSIRERFGSLVHVPFNFEDGGTRVVVNEPNGL